MLSRDLGAFFPVRMLILSDTEVAVRPGPCSTSAQYSVLFYQGRGYVHRFTLLQFVILVPHGVVSGFRHCSFARVL